jgi:hypothetical protein
MAAVRLLQVTDTHLMGDAAAALRGVATLDSLRRVLRATGLLDAPDLPAPAPTRLMQVAQAEGEAARYAVDWTGRFAGATPSVAWTVTGANGTSASITGPVASIVVSGLTEGNVAELLCAATSDGETSVARFRVACPQLLPVSGVV